MVDTKLDVCGFSIGPVANQVRVGQCVLWYAGGDKGAAADSSPNSLPGRRSDFPTGEGSPLSSYDAFECSPRPAGRRRASDPYSCVDLLAHLRIIGCREQSPLAICALCVKSHRVRASRPWRPGDRAAVRSDLRATFLRLVICSAWTSLIHRDLQIRSRA
ncbi:hypothetical protein OH76DRAFT_456957 [Lentinus brumalis]|uniref:Uncharacterized protein n=1 Tax=Lentinus brumalis TaxID=2498619 RepID=A0A371DDF6_9APHY|nr:hypothetical protein OH76DRAFT_456957 [Polyporus brumalis]